MPDLNQKLLPEKWSLVITIVILGHLQAYLLRHCIEIDGKRSKLLKMAHFFLSLKFLTENLHRIDLVSLVSGMVE